jgi:hypothetical protein
MADNVTYLPRPRAVRPVPNPLGLYFRAGRNDHKALLNLLSAGDLGCFGVVIDAVHVDRHRELREQVVEHRLDAVLDPQTQAAATIGGYTEAIGELPWAIDRPHQVSDFAGLAGRERMATGSAAQAGPGTFAAGEHDALPKPVWLPRQSLLPSQRQRHAREPSPALPLSARRGRGGVGTDARVFTSPNVS